MHFKVIKEAKRALVTALTFLLHTVNNWISTLILQSLLDHITSNSTLLEYFFSKQWVSEWVSALNVSCFWSELTLQRHKHRLKSFFFSWIPCGWLAHKGNFCKWSNSSGISSTPSPKNTVGSSHCGMLGSPWLVYRVYRILCCLWNVVVGNLLCSSWNTIPAEVISAIVMQFNYYILMRGGVVSRIYDFSQVRLWAMVWHC